MPTVFIRSLSVLIPVIGEGLPRAILLVTVFGAFAVVNIRGGARGGVRVVELVTVAKLAPLALLVVFGWTPSLRPPTSAAWRCG